VTSGPNLCFQASAYRDQLASTLLVHLHALDSHSPGITLTPGRQPELARIPELLRCSQTSVTPWLVPNAVLEEAVGTADGNIEDQIELLVEWSVAHACLGPRVEESGLVRLVRAKVAAVPHGLRASSELDKEDLLRCGSVTCFCSPPVILHLPKADYQCT